MICFGCGKNDYDVYDNISNNFDHNCSDIFYNIINYYMIAIFNRKTNFYVRFSSKMTEVYPNDISDDPINYVVDSTVDYSNLEECYNFFIKLEKLQVFR